MQESIVFLLRVQCHRKESSRSLSHLLMSFLYCIAGIVIVCHFVCNLMAFVCQEIKGLLTYLLTYLFSLVISTLAACRLHDSE